MIEAIKSISEAAKDEQPQDYEQDGLLYCGKCHTPKQARITINGLVLTPFCACKCKIEEMERQKQEREERERIEKISRLRSVGLPEKELQSCVFENDDGTTPKITDCLLRYVNKWDKMYSGNVGLLLWGGVGNARGNDPLARGGQEWGRGGRQRKKRGKCGGVRGRKAGAMIFSPRVAASERKGADSLGSYGAG